MRSIWDDIDKAYHSLESLGTGPQGLATWKDAQKKKEQLDDLLPAQGGIRARPQVRTVLVPRSKDT